MDIVATLAKVVQPQQMLQLSEQRKQHETRLLIGPEGISPNRAAGSVTELLGLADALHSSRRRR